MLSSTSTQARFFRRLRSLLRAPYPLVHLRTHEENRAVDTIHQLADEGDRRLREWRPVGGFEDVEDGSSEPADALEAIAAASDGEVFVIRGGHRFVESERVRRWLRAWAEETTAAEAASGEGGVSVVLISPFEFDAPELAKDLTRLSMPLPGRDALAPTCEEVFGPDELPEADRDRLVAGALGLTRREARRAFHRVRQQYREAVERNAVFDLEEAILSEKKRMIGESDVLEYHPLEVGLDDVGGLEILKRWLDERRDAFGERARAFGLPMPKGLLLIGVQGCGKSLTAKAVARHWGLPLLRLDLGAIFDGSRPPEEALNRAIETCEAIAPCVLWTDEIEKGFAGDGGGRADRVLGSLLTWQQEKTDPVFLVATANDVEELPPELLRKGRFDEIFFIDLPDRWEREEILDIHLKRRGRSFPDEVVEDIAAKAEYFSGAELEQVVVSAMYTAFAEERELAADDLSYACREIVPLYRTYEQRIKSLREWAQGRARSASHEKELLDYFE